MKHNWKGISLSLVLLFILLLSIQGIASADEVLHLTIVTGSIGGTYYPVGTGIAEMMNNNIEGVSVSAEQSGGSMENPRLVGQGEADFGITNADMAYYAYNGEEPFKEKQNILAVGAIHDSTFQVVTLKGDEIKTIEDLVGKSVSLGPIGSGSTNALRLVLEEYGLSPEDDIVASYLGQSEAADALKDGRIDAMAVLGGRPHAALMELDATRDFDIVQIDDSIIEKIVEDNIFFSKVTVPGETYSLDYDYNTLTVFNLLFCQADMDEDLIYNTTKALYENLDLMKDYHISFDHVQLENATEVPIPIHPGAIRYYKEKGIL